MPKIEITEQYDPLVHVTAGYLRRAGFTIPDDVPDCAFVRRDAIHFDAPDVRASDTGIDVMDVTITALVSEPFHWAEATLTMIKEKGRKDG